MFKRFYLKSVLSLLLAVTILLSPHSLNAEDTSGRKGPVRVGVLDIEQATNHHSRELLERYIRAYLRELSKRTHLGYDYIPVLPQDGKRMLEEGSLDLLVPVQGNTAIRPARLFSEGYSVYGILSLYTMPGTGLDVLDGSTMNGITIGYVTVDNNSGYISHYVETHGWTDVKYITYADGQNMMNALHNGEIQAAMDDGSNLLGNEIELGIIAVAQCHFMGLPANQELVQELNAAILDAELKNPSFGTLLEQTYIDPAIHSIANYSERELNFTKTAPPVRLVLTNSFPPFIDGDYGIFRDIVETMFKDSGLTLEIVKADNSQEARDMINSGKADILPFVYSGDNSETPTNYTNNFMTVEYSAIVHEDTGVEVTPKNMVIPANIPGLRRYVEQQYPEWNVTVLATVDDCLDGVGKKQYSMALVPHLYLIKHSSLVTRSNLIISDAYSCHIGISIMVSESAPDMLTQVLNTSIQRLSTDEVNHIIKNDSHPVLNPGFLFQEYPIQLAIAILMAIITILGISFIVHINRKTKKHNIELQEKNDELERIFKKVKSLTKDRDAYKQEAETDPLTGLLNKKGFDIRCQELLKRQQDGESIALIIIDLDHFKNFNDTYGHQMGDKLLVAFSNILKATCTDLTAAGRFGGDEFMMMVTIPMNSTIAEITKQCRWLLTLIKDMMIDGHAANVTGSIGVAITRESGTSYDYLFRKADRALYKVKEAGRNGFQIYDKE